MSKEPQNQTATLYSPEVIRATKRVGRIFAEGCDRCDADDLDLLESAGLMERGVCTDTSGQDTLEEGEAMWTFNAVGEAVIAAILS